MLNMSVKAGDDLGSLGATMVEWCRDNLDKPDGWTDDDFDDACHKCAEAMADAAYSELLRHKPLA